MTTIYDIAKRAGVSPTTVSKVLNGYKDVSVKTREKVKRITHEMGYKPNLAARSLVTNQTMTIGVFFQDHVNSGFRHPFLHDVIASFKDVIGEAGYDLLFFANVSQDNAPKGFEERARNRNVDGLFLLGVPRTDPGLVQLAKSKIPIVSIDLDMIGSRASYLCSDNVQGARDAVQFLVENGHSHIAFVGDRFGTKPGHDRMIGYQQALQEFSLPYRTEWLIDGDFTEASGYHAMSQLLACNEIPTAVFFASDMMAIGAMRRLTEAGLQPGEDISLVGFDDIELARYVTPALTTVRQNTEEMGRVAAAELLALMNQQDKPPAVYSLQTQIIVRDSVKNLFVSKLS